MDKTSAPEPHNTLMRLMAQSIRDWMARELQYPKVQKPESMATEKPGRESTAVMRACKSKCANGTAELLFSSQNWRS